MSTVHTHDPDEPGLAVEMYLREHMTEVHGRTVAGSYAALRRAEHDEEHPERSTRGASGGPPEKIRYAEQLMRREHRVVDDDYLFWGKVAEHLNDAANIP